MIYIRNTTRVYKALLTILLTQQNIDTLFRL